MRRAPETGLQAPAPLGGGRYAPDASFRYTRYFCPLRPLPGHREAMLRCALKNLRETMRRRPLALVAGESL